MLKVTRDAKARCVHGGEIGDGRWSLLQLRQPSRNLPPSMKNDMSVTRERQKPPNRYRGPMSHGHTSRPNGCFPLGGANCGQTASAPNRLVVERASNDRFRKEVLDLATSEMGSASDRRLSTLGYRRRRGGFRTVCFWERKSQSGRYVLSTTDEIINYASAGTLGMARCEGSATGTAAINWRV